MLFERRCPGCGRQARSVCWRCLDLLDFTAIDPGELDGLAATAGLDRLDVAFSYDRHASRIVLAAKNGGRRDVLRQLAHLVPTGFEPIDAVTWVPASRGRHRERGYDQGQVLARQVARRQCKHAPARRLLARPRSEAQAGRNRAERLAGPSLVALTRSCPNRVLVVDDVTTTGASLASAASALRAAGASYVAAGVLAAVPPPARREHRRRGTR